MKLMHTLRSGRRQRASERGQTATEYVLIISVVVLGLLAAASALIPNMGEGVTTLSKNLTQRFERDPETDYER